MKVRNFLLSLVMLVAMIVMSACKNSVSVANLIEDDFCGKSVIVVMTQEASAVNRVHDKETFGAIASQIVEIEDLTYCDDLECVCCEGITQILCLTLSKDDKANVLRVVKYLNNLDVVDFADPQYFLTPTKRGSK